MAFLKIVAGRNAGAAVELRGARVEFGRDATCALVAEDAGVSRVHFRVEPEGDGFVVADCRSSNGTWVNGQRIKKHPLRIGDKIAAGGTIVMFLADPNDAGVVEAPVAAVEPHFALQQNLHLLAQFFRAERAVVLAPDEAAECLASCGGAWAPDDARARAAIESVRADRQQVVNESAVCAPVVSGDRLLGVLYLDGRKEVSFAKSEQAAFLATGLALLAEPLEAALAQRAQRERLRRAEEAVVATKPSPEAQDRYEGLIGRSASMKQIFRLLRKVASSDMPVLVEGETGTGKEVVARAIHATGARRTASFVAENCAAIAPTIMESELFGHVRGAFTGADRDREGLFERADGGTLFLDEIADMSEDLQKKLLRALEEGEIRRVGGADPIKVNVRLIAASNRPLAELVKAGRFREDLYFRLNVVTVAIPPLRERAEDIPLLAEHFLEEMERRGGVRKRLARDAAARLLEHPWPGNVRELRNVIERAAQLAEGDTITAADIGLGPQAWPQPEIQGLDFKAAKSRVIETFERRFLIDALVRHRGNVSEVATELRLERRHVYTLLEQYELDPDSFRA